jgi:hypothetical protein
MNIIDSQWNLHLVKNLKNYANSIILNESNSECLFTRCIIASDFLLFNLFSHKNTD